MLTFRHADDEAVQGGGDLDLGGVEFLGVEIRHHQGDYKLTVPNRKLQQIDIEMGRIASLDVCIKERRNIGYLVRQLDAFIIGHYTAVAHVDHALNFLSRLEALKVKHLTALLESIVGRPIVRHLDDNRLAILGLKQFA